ncbi:MAG: prepilin-type N-terminal cleavage/methylation domain-containing protein [Vulcanimicrobiota bacterium]
MPKCLKRNKGLSLLEIMISIGLFTVIMMAFAMTFPFGMKLTQKVEKRNQATQIANAIVDRLHTVEWTPSTLYSLNIEDLENSPDIDESLFNNYIPAGSDFVIPDGGIVVDFRDSPRNSLVLIQVTVEWNDILQGSAQKRSVTVQSMRADCRR